MPELPEVEVLVRYLGPRVEGGLLDEVSVFDSRIDRPHSAISLSNALLGRRVVGLRRRAKYLVFHLVDPESGIESDALGHLGMTGRMYLARAASPLPKHVVMVLGFGEKRLVFQDPRRFGRFFLIDGTLNQLGPEPFDEVFDVTRLASELRRSNQPIKARLLDQTMVAGIGNIYASEVLFQAGISPQRSCKGLEPDEIERLHRAIRSVLLNAITEASKASLDFANGSDGLFYFGSAKESSSLYEERLNVYGRAGEPCFRCQTTVRRLIQSGRSTFYCPICQE